MFDLILLRSRSVWVEYHSEFSATSISGMELINCRTFGFVQTLRLLLFHPSCRNVDKGAAEAPLDEHPPSLLAAAPQDPGRGAAAAGGQGADGLHRQRQRTRHRRAEAGALQLGGLLLGVRPRGGGGAPGQFHLYFICTKLLCTAESSSKCTNYTTMILMLL